MVVVNGHSGRHCLLMEIWFIMVVNGHKSPHCFNGVDIIVNWFKMVTYMLIWEGEK